MSPTSGNPRYPSLSEPHCEMDLWEDDRDPQITLKGIKKIVTMDLKQTLSPFWLGLYFMSSLEQLPDSSDVTFARCGVAILKQVTCLLFISPGCHRTFHLVLFMFPWFT